VICGFEFGVWPEGWFRPMMEQRICDRAAEVLVEEDEHESHFASLFGQAIGVTSIMAF
jgi:hypothetical protein